MLDGGDIIAILSVALGTVFNLKMLKINREQFITTLNEERNISYLDRTYKDKKNAFENAINFILQRSVAVPHSNSDWKNEWRREYSHLSFSLSLYSNKNLIEKFDVLFSYVLSFTELKIKNKENMTYKEKIKNMNEVANLSNKITIELDKLLELMKVEISK